MVVHMKWEDAQTQSAIQLAVKWYMACCLEAGTGLGLSSISGQCAQCQTSSGVFCAYNIHQGEGNGTTACTTDHKVLDAQHESISLCIVTELKGAEVPIQYALKPLHSLGK